jgi:Ca2+-binding EF-hand superfamily protein
MKKSNLIASTLMACVLLPAAAFATTYEKTVTTTPEARPNTIYIDFMKFDMNRDGILSRNEIGETLFYIFDTDGNEVIDNNEINAKKVYTMSPMVEETVVKVDFNDDGQADMSDVSYNSFLDRSHLSRFSTGEKMSAREFIGDSFLRLDDDESKVIELGEWKESYSRSIAPETTEPERYNR